MARWDVTTTTMATGDNNDNDDDGEGATGDEVDNVATMNDDDYGNR